MSDINHNLLCDAATSHLVIIDTQTRLTAAMKEPVREQVIANSSRLCQAATLLDIPITHTEQYPQGLGETEPALQTYLASEAIEKTSFSCCKTEPFPSRLAQERRRQIVLCGMESHVCVLQTAMHLKQLGYQVFVVEDAVCSRHKHHHKNALQRLHQAGIVVSSTESTLFEWLQNASHEHFKVISRLIR